MLASLIEELARMPAAVERLIHDLGDEPLRRKPGPEPDAFALVEHVLHLRDLEVEGYSVRLRRTLAEAHPLLPDLDGTQLAIERRYREQPIRPALAAFTQARHANVELLRRVTVADLDRTAELEGVGSLTLAQLLVRWRDHDAAHVAEMTALRALVR
jgi:hypothetical protein